MSASEGRSTIPRLFIPLALGMDKCCALNGTSEKLYGQEHLKTLSICQLISTDRWKELRITEGNHNLRIIRSSTLVIPIKVRSVEIFYTHVSISVTFIVSDKIHQSLHDSLFTQPLQYNTTMYDIHHTVSKLLLRTTKSNTQLGPKPQ